MSPTPIWNPKKRQTHPKQNEPTKCMDCSRDCSFNQVGSEAETEFFQKITAARDDISSKFEAKRRALAQKWLEKGLEQLAADRQVLLTRLASRMDAEGEALAEVTRRQQKEVDRLREELRSVFLSQHLGSLEYDARLAELVGQLFDTFPTEIAEPLLQNLPDYEEGLRDLASILDVQPFPATGAPKNRDPPRDPPSTSTEDEPSRRYEALTVLDLSILSSLLYGGPAPDPAPFPSSSSSATPAPASQHLHASATAQHAQHAAEGCNDIGLKRWTPPALHQWSYEKAKKAFFRTLPGTLAERAREVKANREKVCELLEELQKRWVSIIIFAHDEEGGGKTVMSAGTDRCVDDSLLAFLRIVIAFEYMSCSLVSSLFLIKSSLVEKCVV